MSSSKEYLNYILEQLAPLEEIAYRPMMGEYILYYQGKVVGGIYDDRLLVKPVKSAVAYLPAAPRELPYDGAKEMLLVEDVDDKALLTGLFRAWLMSSRRRSANKYPPQKDPLQNSAGGLACTG